MWISIREPRQREGTKECVVSCSKAEPRAHTLRKQLSSVGRVSRIRGSDSCPPWHKGTPLLWRLGSLCRYAGNDVRGMLEQTMTLLGVEEASARPLLSQAEQRRSAGRVPACDPPLAHTDGGDTGRPPTRWLGAGASCVAADSAQVGLSPPCGARPLMPSPGPVGGRRTHWVVSSTFWSRHRAPGRASAQLKICRHG